MTAGVAARIAVALVCGVALVGCGAEVAPIERVVLLTLDTTRADRIGCYGYAGAETPRLDAFANESVLFEQAVSPVPTTLPAHATMLTGVYPHDHGVRYNIQFRLSAGARTLTEALREAGFATAAFPSSMILSRRFGLDQGFDVYEDEQAQSTRAPDDHPEALLRSAGEGVDLALDWLARQRGRKSFAWLHFYDPHGPYDPPFPFSDRFRERPYDGEIAYCDAQFGRLLEALREDPDWGRTLLIVAGDHGEGLYDHGERFHALMVYETTQRVPLLIHAPGIRPSRVAEPVTLADIAPTVLDLTGVSESKPMRGISLRPSLVGEALPKRDIYFETLAGALTYGWAELKGLRSGRFKLIDSDEPELYDLEADPGEQNDLARLEAQRVQEMRAALARLDEPIVGGAALSQPDTQVGLDPETEAMLASLGYVAGAVGGSLGEGAVQPRSLVHLQAELLMAQNGVMLKQWAYVAEVCAFVLSEDPSNKWALSNLSQSMLELGRTEEALDPAFELVRLFPDNERAYVRLAGVLRELGEADKVYEVLQGGMVKLPDSEWLDYLATVAAFDVERPAVCVEDVPAAVARRPKSSRMLVLRARCEARDGDPERALASIEAAVELGFGQLPQLEEAEEFAETIELSGWKQLRERLEVERRDAQARTGESE